MPNVSIFLHKSVKDHLDHEANNILEMSRSETVETMIRYIFDGGLMGEVFEKDEYAEKLEEFEKRVEEYEESLEDEDEEEESEEEEEEEED